MVQKTQIVITPISDEKLFQLCRMYGARALQWRQKFIGLLPEVFRRKLYEKKGFSSIFEFAKKLAGLSEEQVRLTLNLEKRFEDKPILKNLLVNGEVSINKLARIVSIATPDNEKELAEKIKLLPKSALATFVRDEKAAQQEEGNKIQDGLFKTKNGVKSLPGQTLEEWHFEDGSRVEISDETKTKLHKLQQKRINLDELLQEFFEKREQEITQEKEQISEEIQAQQGLAHTNGEPKSSRYIPAKIRNIIKEEYGTKCSIPSCNKPAEVIHHTQRFALTRTHDPNYLAPLCQDHHKIAHSIDVKFQQKWREAVR